MKGLPTLRDGARRRARWLALVASAFGVLATVASAWAGSQEPTGTIVFGRDLGGGNVELFAIDADGSNERRLTNHPAFDWAPSVSRNGSIAFTSDRDGNAEIYVLEKNGGLRRVTNTPGWDEITPAWSPDGRKLAVTRAPAGGIAACLGPPFDCSSLEIAVIDSDGASPRQLTDNAAEDSGPRWSPNGKKITFTTYRDGNYEVYVMNADGGRPTNLTNDPSQDGFAWPPATWSPDGRSIAFGRMPADFDFSGFEIYVMNVDGSDVRRLTDSAADGPAQSPVWSPNGRHIAFQRFVDFDDTELWVMERDGRNQRPLTSSPEAEHTHDWGSSVADG